MKDNKKVILPAYEYSEWRNHENPELYAIFPYRLFGVSKENLELAQNTYDARLVKEHHCWSQDDIQAAMLGRTEEVSDYIVDRASAKNLESRFPAFWEAGHDWVPDMDTGGVFSMALQSMLIQADDGKIILFPAWPKNWDASFKLRAPQNTIIECVYRENKIISLEVQPRHRKKDIVICI